MKITDIIRSLREDRFANIFRELYGNSEKALKYQKERYIKAAERFSELYPERTDVRIFSAPGRTEIGGNHTDHQHGCVLAAAVNLDAVAVVAFHNDGVIRVKSEGYEKFKVSLSELSPKKYEKGSPAIVRGVAARFASMGAKIGGFDMYSTSDVLTGSGVSSSAAFETLIGTIIDTYYNESRAGAVEIAKIGQYAENVYFGKNSGLMDQMVSSVGGLVGIDFRDTEDPEIRSFKCDFEEYGYCLCITDTKGSHADLTPDYDAVRSEMEEIAGYFGKPYLRETDEEEFFKALPAIRKKCSDRSILRAMHFFSDNRRAVLEANALRDGNMEYFLALVRESGDSSANYLQNLYSCSKPLNQEIPLAIALSKKVLGGSGAVRVHGGGFAGTIQAFVPLEKADEYINEMNRIFGENSCQKMRIRPYGGIEITKEVF